MDERVDHLAPVVHLRRRARQAEVDHDQLVEALLAEHQRQLVDRVLDVLLRDDRVERHVAEQRELAADIFFQRDFRPADQHVGRDADLAQLGHALLAGLGLDLAGGLDEGDVGQVDVHHVVAAILEADLAERLEEGQPLDVADGAALLDEDHVDALLVHGADAGLDLVGDVRDHLDRAAEVVAVALLAEHVPIDAAGGEIALLRGRLAREPLVMAQIEVGFRAVVGHIDLAVLEGAHRARIDVQVGVDLDHPDVQPAVDQEAADRGRGQALAQGADHAARDENIFCHDSNFPGKGFTRRAARSGMIIKPIPPSDTTFFPARRHFAAQRQASSGFAWRKGRRRRVGGRGARARRKRGKTGAGGEI